MLLAVDVGNSNVKMGLFDNSRIVNTFRIHSDSLRAPDEYLVFLQTFLKKTNLTLDDIHDIVISSVVPPIGLALNELGESLGLTPLNIGPGVKTGINIATEYPRELGADLVVNAAMAWDIFKSPCIAVAFGTALTFTIVNSQGKLIGVAIAPGVNSSLLGLLNNSAQLKNISFRDPGNAIGRNTVDSLQAGFYYGFSSILKGVVERIELDLGAKVNVVVTGYHAEFFKKEIDQLGIYEPWLTLKGLQMIYDKNKGK